MRFGNPLCSICGHVHPIGYECDGWSRTAGPTFGDHRKLVTLEKDGMRWVGIRAYNGQAWLNNNQPEDAKIVAWKDLPEPAV